ncbi:MAG TPA: hypothetical protein VF383_00540 [Candidatus Dormibacteraeota bacterium]
MAPSLLESDSGPDIDESEVVVERVVADGREDPPDLDGARDQQEPPERGEA